MIVFVESAPNPVLLDPLGGEEGNKSFSTNNF